MLSPYLSLAAIAAGAPEDPTEGEAAAPTIETASPSRRTRRRGQAPGPATAKLIGLGRRRDQYAPWLQ